MEELNVYYEIKVGISEMLIKITSLFPYNFKNFSWANQCVITLFLIHKLNEPFINILLCKPINNLLFLCQGKYLSCHIYTSEKINKSILRTNNFATMIINIDTIFTITVWSK